MFSVYGENAPRTIFAVTLGMLGAAVLVAGAEKHNLLAVGVACGLPVALLLSVQPRRLTLLFLLAILVLEEFPSGEGETLERSTRTAFYSVSLGIPGFYAPDALLAATLAGFTIRLLLLKQSFALPLDRISLGIALLCAVLLTSTGLSVLFGSPFDAAVANVSTTMPAVNERAAKLIALFQFKNFSLLVFAYLLGLFFFRRRRDLDNFVHTFLAAAVIMVPIGVIRFALHPRLMAENKPLFYHSPTTWIFGLVIFYVLCLWIYRKTTPRQLLWLGILCIILSGFIFASFRRTMWGAIILAAVVLAFLIPPQQRHRYFLLIMVGIAGMGAALLFSPGLLAAIMNRINETSVSDPSTLYRMTLFIWFHQNLADLPLMGVGFRPLWDIQARLGYFSTNLENIHSLYFWILLRLGLLGALCLLVILGLTIWEILRKLKNRRYAEYHALVICIFLALVMLLFSGIFNPVYAEVRYMILFGFSLAIISRLPQIIAQSPAKL
ncbi:O-antigen ligase family protein [Methylomonas sp. HYX-M1]|uniref:O-antigen ligase family protein n=1 Tax=Methylomonas sp. HYX-M1 TaxID=3139307 RepID=UPI00345B8672